jgi:diguanylate cyclase (GGDEF)-like protein
MAGQGASLGVEGHDVGMDRAIRALVALIDDLTVERDEHGLLVSTLAEVVRTLGLTGGAIFLEESQGLTLAVETALSMERQLAALDAARSAIEAGRPVGSARMGGGWHAATPLLTRQKQLGVLTLFSSEGPDAFPGTELLGILGKQIGTGLENVRLYTELRASSRRTEILNRIVTTLTSSMDLKSVTAAFASELVTIVPFDRLVLAFVNESGDYIETVGHPPGTVWGLAETIPVVGSGPGSVVLNSQPVIQTDLLRNHRFIEDMRLLEEGVRSYILAPLNSRGRSVGVLALGSNQPHSYSQQSLTVLQPLLDSAALALENVRLFQKTREMSITDEVTPLYNFRFFHQLLDRELRLVDRYHSVLSLIFLDLDRFKPINDQHGHLRGSRVLREVGFLVRACVRDGDYPARYGGDEFCVIMPQTDRDVAFGMAEKIRLSIEEHVFLQEEGINARLGLSYGIATYPTDALTKEGLIRLADARMYADKDDRKTGR